jgi:1,4-dihydroxy-2-naphthoyl-CoA hydrolase
MIWKQPATAEGLNEFRKNTLDEALGIEFTEIGPDYIVGTMPVTSNTVQPFRILHGGANVCLAESLGSVASTLCVEDLTTHMAVGLEINANHLRSVPEGGKVTGTCRPIRVGKSVHVWDIQIRNEAGDITCISRLTVSVVERRIKK